MFSAYVFDAYGTLFDVHSAVARHADDVGPSAESLSALWRTKQLEYTWVRSLMGAYLDFRALTEEALVFACARHGIADGALQAALLAAYDTLAAYPECASTLAALKEAGARTAILSNGTPAMLAAALDASCLRDLVDDVFSVDALRVYKTDPRAYALVVEALGVEARAVSFQSSNRWDVAGAARFGFRTVWIDRTGAPDEYRDFAPAHTLTSLSGLAGL